MFTVRKYLGGRGAWGEGQRIKHKNQYLFPMRLDLPKNGFLRRGALLPVDTGVHARPPFLPSRLLFNIYFI